jgi:hypothetical protein
MDGRSNDDLLGRGLEVAKYRFIRTRAVTDPSNPSANSSSSAVYGID